MSQTSLHQKLEAYKKRTKLQAELKNYKMAFDTSNFKPYLTIKIKEIETKLSEL